MPPWHSDDSFWTAVELALFSPERLALASADVDGAVGLLSLQPAAKVLDLCSGPGRHAIELARRGYQVTGVDRTRSYLDRAAELARESGASIEWVQADMRDFVRPKAFDAVINLYTSFGYFENEAENRRVAENMRKSLRPGGSALLELMSTEVVARDFRERWWIEEGDTVLLERRMVDKSWTRIRAHWIVLQGGKRYEFDVEHHLYSGAELRALLLDVGFASVDLFGTLHGDPYDRHADRLVAVASR